MFSVCTVALTVPNITTQPFPTAAQPALSLLPPPPTPDPTPQETRPDFPPWQPADHEAPVLAKEQAPPLLSLVETGGQGQPQHLLTQ